MDVVQIINDIYWYFLISSFLIGACIGSFLNVVIYRLPDPEKSIVKPRSFCPSCKTPIAGYDNIPIFSFLLLKGQCRHCGQRIGFRYPLIEAMTGGFAVAYFHLSFAHKLWPYHVGFIYFILTCALIAITFIDIDLQIIPNIISLPGIPIGLACSFIMPHGFINALIGMVLGAGTLWLIGWIYLLATKREGMGFGDVKLMGMLGAFLGWVSIPFTFMVASLLGLLVGVPYIIKRNEGTRTPIPFGPFLAFGAVLYIFAGLEIIDWYFELFRR